MTGTSTRPHASGSLFDRVDVCLLTETPHPTAPLPTSTSALAQSLVGQGHRTKVLAMPQGQTAAELRTLPYVIPGVVPVVQVRRKHGPVVFDPVIFAGRFEAVRHIWGTIATPEVNELLLECLKHPARVYVATAWSQLLPAVVAAEYHGAVVLFAPAVDDLAACPITPGSMAMRDAVHEQMVVPSLLTVVVADATQRAAYQAIYGDRVFDEIGGVQQLVPVTAAIVDAALPMAVPRDASTDHPAAMQALTARADTTPLLSIAIPTFQRSRLLLDTLSSVCAQAARYGLESQLELVISDNASADDTEAVVAWLTTQTRIPVRYHRNAVNRGVGFNVMQAMACSTGTFCCLLGDDDFLIEGALPRMLQALVAPEEVALVVFAASDMVFGYTEPTRISLEAVTRQYFYHVGNLGLAVVRMAPCRPSMTERSWTDLQRFWPQTQTYFYAMLAVGGAADGACPALAVPSPVVFQPLHGPLTTYTGRYRWDEGCFSLYDVALRLQPEMPTWFMPVIHETYFQPRFQSLRAPLLESYGVQDQEADRARAVQTMAETLALCATWSTRMGAESAAVLIEITDVLMRYAAPASVDGLRERLDLVHAALHTPRDFALSGIPAAAA